MTTTQATSLANDIESRGYTHPESLVSTDWVAAHLNDDDVRIIESNEDPLLYSAGHIPNAVEVDWTRDLNDQLIRDYLDREQFGELMSRIGVTRDTTVILYGDKNNWWACYTFWIFQLFGHTKAKMMDGGRVKWELEQRQQTRETPSFATTTYEAPQRDDSANRAFRDQVLKHIKAHGSLVDVRSPEEYSGERLHMPDYPNEGALRGGHIPGAVSIPWSKAINPDNGAFKTAQQLKDLYQKQNNISPGDDVIAYCRIGERSSHTWFVLKYLLGYKKVRNYDGSWTEWGNLVGAPIEK